MTRVPWHDRRVDDPGRSTITLRYWAAAKSAAGVASDEVEVDGPVALSWAIEQAVRRHPGRLADVLASCSVLLGERPVTAEDPDRVEVAPGSTLEFLPPFAGG